MKVVKIIGIIGISLLLFGCDNEVDRLEDKVDLLEDKIDALLDQNNINTSTSNDSVINNGEGTTTVDTSNIESTIKNFENEIRKYEDKLDIELSEKQINAIKKVNPWLNLFVQNYETKLLIEKEGLKAALEVDFDETSSIRQIRELPYKPDTLHFRKLEDIKRAYDVIKPTPINYNRVQNQI